MHTRPRLQGGLRRRGAMSWLLKYKIQEGISPRVHLKSTTRSHWDRLGIKTAPLRWKTVRSVVAISASSSWPTMDFSQSPATSPTRRTQGSRWNGRPQIQAIPAGRAKPASTWRLASRRSVPGGQAGPPTAKSHREKRPATAHLENWEVGAGVTTPPSLVSARRGTVTTNSDGAAWW